MLNEKVVRVLGVLIMLCSPALAATWYVNGVNGDDGNNCKTKATACATIGHAISLAASGDIIQIAAATYQENLSIPFNLTLNGAKAATTIVDGTQTANVFTVGAGISLTLANLTIKNGVGYPAGGGVNNSGTLTVYKSNFYTNTGGAILNTGTVTVTNSNLSGNSAYFYGHSASCGAIDNQGAMTISNTTFYSNYANNYSTAGGAICNGGTMTITGTTFNDNQSEGTGGYGGAIYAYAGTLSVTNSTFYLNSATTGGGAIYNQGGTVQISNSTFGINAATSGGGGGALNNAGGSFLIQNSIVDNTGYGGNCAGVITSDGYNVSGDSSCNFSGPGDLNNTNPKLGALRSNGGPTQTMALQKTSPALDAGNPTGCTDFAGNLLKTDQRGMPRPGGGETTGCDMGAYESQTY